MIVGFLALTSAQNIWPLPQSISVGNATTTINDLTLVASPTSQKLTDAFARVKTRIFSRAAPNTGAPSVITLTVGNADAPLVLGADESYTLVVSPQGAITINANSQFGAYHALETLSQLVTFDFPSKTYRIVGVPVAIQDAPRFPHRGLLIDSARHFQPIPFVKRMVDALTYVKMNVLHWHLTEDQAFPIESRAFPNLGTQGAYNLNEVYTLEEVADVVAYAEARGVRVIPEFDMPGHTTSWRNAIPDIFTTSCQTGRGAFDPAVNKTFDVIDAAVRDWFNGVFKSDFVHFGTDEVPTECWNNPRDADFIAKHNLKDLNGLFNYFIGRVHDIAAAQGKSVIMWDESFMSASPPKDSVIQIWHDASLLARIVQAGYRAIFSPNGGYTNGWYLDGLSATFANMYNLEPMTNVDPKYFPQVLGGEACMWGETVDGSDFEFTVWPRTAAVAERLWSNANAISTLNMDRAHAMRCLLLARGVGAGYVTGNGREAPPGPGPCNQ